MTETPPNDAPEADAPETDALETEAPETEVAAAEPRVLTLQQFPEKLAIVKLPPGAEIPEWAESSSLFSITATATETSLICAGRNVPTKQVAHKGLTAFAVMGELDLTEGGVLADLLVPLAEAGLSVFTISTYETNWVLVPVAKADVAAEAWRRRGHTVDLAVPVQPPRRKRS